jgi:hypothetical protein
MGGGESAGTHLRKEKKKKKFSLESTRKPTPVRICRYTHRINQKTHAESTHTESTRKPTPNQPENSYLPFGGKFTFGINYFSIGSVHT